jgi:photosystem II stability/assembly factor-like uncharacterized protein
LIINSVWSIGQLLYANTFDSGLFVSPDYGDNWRQTDTNTTPFSYISAVSTFDSNIFVGSWDNIFHSNDNGKSWRRTNFAGLQVSGFAKKGDSIFCCTNDGSNTSGEIFISIDDGKSWVHLWGDFATEALFSITAYNKGLFVGTCNYGVLASYDGGLNWQQQNNGLLNKYVLSVENFNEFLFAATAGGAFVSYDAGQSWQDINSGLLSGRIISFAEIDNDLFVSSDAHIYKSNNRGTSWISLPTDKLVESPGLIFLMKKYLFMETNGITYRSEDKGNTWTKLYANGEQYVNSLFSFGDYLIGESDGNEVIISKNFGDVWENRQSTQLPVITFGSIGYVLMASINGLGFTPDYVLRSRDTAQTWQSIIVSPDSSSITTFASIGNKLLAGTYGEGIYLSLDSGITWTLDNFGMEGRFVKSIRAFGENVYCCSEKGIFFSSDSGQHWLNANYGLVNTNVYDIASIGNDLYAGIYGAGIWKRSLTGLSVAAPSRKIIIQNFPNPFFQSTSIKFSTQDHSFAQVSIHNLLGSEVARLFSGELDGGEHTFTWEAQNMSAGMYICSVQTGDQILHLPLVIIK